MNHAHARSEDSGLHRVRPVRAPARPSKSLPGIVTQIRIAFRSRNRMAAVAGLLMGGAIPFMGYFIAHHELSRWLTIQGVMVCGALLFSALTVWQWGRAGFACPWKATGFSILLEGVMVFSEQPWLAQLALAYLIVINGIATGVRFSQQR